MGDRRGDWWRRAVIYEVYIRSFADGNGDGVGDLVGLRRRLPYLRELGVDAVWLTPFYVSPMADGGYDVADHREVDPEFGTMEDFDLLLDHAHNLGLRLIVDIVPNHTSIRHPWFAEAIAADPGSRVRDRYIFRPGRGSDGGRPPNDWESVFGGPAWTRETRPDGSPGEWYLHLFAPEQPDLNWANPHVRAEYDGILRFWLDRGVDGIRVDVAHGLVKDPTFRDAGPRARRGRPGAEPVPYFDQDGVHEIYREWRKILESYPGERMAVAEAWVHGAERIARYVRRDELHQAFNFDFLLAGWDATELRGVITDSLAATAAVGAPSTWVLSNHDVVRHPTRYGGGVRGLRRARAAALLMLALPGSAYIYQGEELGLPEVTDLPDDVLQDPTWHRSGYTRRGRDGSRVPLPWSGEQPGLGFTTPRARPWLPMPKTWQQLAVDRQERDPDSIFRLYRTALRVRKEHPALGDGSMTWLRSAPDVLLFRRKPGFICAVNIGAEPVTVPSGGALLCASAPVRKAEAGWLLPADGAVWLASD
jgi:alpha-glucosidase